MVVFLLYKNVPYPLTCMRRNKKRIKKDTSPFEKTILLPLWKRRVRTEKRYVSLQGKQAFIPLWIFVSFVLRIRDTKLYYPL